MKPVLIVLLVCFVPFLAGGNDEPQNSTTPLWNGDVQTFGSLRSMYHDGRIGTQVRLSELLPNPAIYAVGALADLEGEITVIGGKVFLTFPDGDGATRTVVTDESDDGAALLVAAEMTSRIGFEAEVSIPFDEIGRTIAALAIEAGLDPEDRIPFLVKGEFEDLQWHVIDGSRLTAGGSSHGDHLEASVQTHRDRASATLIGFFSTSDQGVFTHHDSTTHIHCVVDETLESGHVDHVVIPAGTIIEVPVLQITSDQITGSWLVAEHDGKPVAPANFWHFSEDGSMAVTSGTDGVETRVYRGTWRILQGTQPIRLEMDLEFILDGMVRRSRSGKALAAIEDGRLTIAVTDVEGGGFPASLNLAPGVDILVLRRAGGATTEGISTGRSEPDRP